MLAGNSMPMHIAADKTAKQTNMNEQSKRGAFMGKSLFIAEKPSVAQEFAKALKVRTQRHDG